MTIWGIVVAAGSGTRFGGPKYDVLLAGRPLWAWAREALTSGGAGDVVIVGDVPHGVGGGLRRRDSVAAGLAHVPDDCTYTLVHDAARPLASPDLVGRVIARLDRGDVDGVVPAIPVRDTIKRVDNEKVVATVDRHVLAAVQTPQGFRTEVLRAAHQASDADATDDAAMVERIGGTVVTVAGDPRNVKVTYPDDLLLAEALVEAGES